MYSGDYMQQVSWYTFSKYLIFSYNIAQCDWSYKPNTAFQSNSNLKLFVHKISLECKKKLSQFCVKRIFDDPMIRKPSHHHPFLVKIFYLVKGDPSYGCV